MGLEERGRQKDCNEKWDWNCRFLTKYLFQNKKSLDFEAETLLYKILLSLFFA